MNRVKKTVLAAVIGGLFAAPAFAGDEQEYDGDLKDAWLDGKLEVAYTLNRHLNPFEIDTRVRQGVAYITGEVDSDIERDLAREIALSIDGITAVEANLFLDDDVIEEAAERAEELAEEAAENDELEREIAQESTDFRQKIDDATTTAAVKSRLVLNGDIEGHEINVDTHNDIVTLRGSVDSDAEKQLAEMIALNSSDVRDVRNELTVESSDS